MSQIYPFQLEIKTPQTHLSLRKPSKKWHFECVTYTDSLATQQEHIHVNYHTQRVAGLSEVCQAMEIEVFGLARHWMVT